MKIISSVKPPRKPIEQINPGEAFRLSDQGDIYMRISSGGRLTTATNVNLSTGGLGYLELTADVFPVNAEVHEK
jgi:hypothetical protein